MRILVVGDAHTDETQDLKRFKALGNMIASKLPDQVIFMGDFVSMNCLSEWDKNKLRKMEGRRYDQEMRAANTALDLSTGPYNKYLSKNAKRKTCKAIEWVYLKGNHEDRVERYIDQNPVLESKVDLEQDLYLDMRGFKVVEYGSNYNVKGVSFTHIPINSGGRAISNPNVCQKALRLYQNSVVFGHCHTLDHNANHLNQALCVGGFFSHVDDYAIRSQNNYWRGVVWLDIYSENRFNFSTVALSKLLKLYT